MPPATYDEIGHDYHEQRRADPRIASAIWAALGAARPVINVGAGTGSYEPTDREVLAIEPSAVMIAQRPPGAARSVQAAAELLPVSDNSFDAAMAILTLQHRSDVERGLAELCRVARSRIVLATIDVDRLGELWLIRDYIPEMLDSHAAASRPSHQARIGPRLCPRPNLASSRKKRRVEGTGASDHAAQQAGQLAPRPNPGRSCCELARERPGPRHGWRGWRRCPRLCCGSRIAADRRRGHPCAHSRVGWRSVRGTGSARKPDNAGRGAVRVTLALRRGDDLDRDAERFDPPGQVTP